MELLGRFWTRVTATVPDLPPSVLLGSAAVAAVLVLTPALWRSTRHVVTIAHEGAHGVAALVSGRRLSGIRLHSDTSGLTVSAGRPTGLGMVLTCAAGYTGPGLFGLGAAALLAAPRTVLELQTSRRKRRAPQSDADQLAGLTPFPALFWVGFFLLVDVGALLLGGYWLLT